MLHANRPVIQGGEAHVSSVKKLESVHFPLNLRKRYVSFSTHGVCFFAFQAREQNASLDQRQAFERCSIFIKFKKNEDANRTLLCFEE